MRSLINYPVLKSEDIAGSPRGTGVRFARLRSIHYHLHPKLGGRWLPVIEVAPEGLCVEVRNLVEPWREPERVRVDEAHFEIT
jgi:hypothetical protein